MNESNISLANVSNISSGSTYCKYNEPDSDVEKTAKRSAFLLLVVVGICLNIFVIILAAKFTERRNLHHLIINMAVSDAVFLFMSLLFIFPSLSDYKWSIYPSGTLGLVICKTIMFLTYTSVAVSLITLLVISVERFRATTITLQRRRHYTLKRRVLILGICWLFPIPIAGYFMYIANFDPNGSCSMPFVTSLAVRVATIILSTLYSILCCTIVILSILTARRLSKPHAIQAHLSEEQQSIRKRRTLAAVKMILVSVFLYACCWLTPSAFLVLRRSIKSLSRVDFRSLSFFIHVFLPVVNSCFSPLIYIIFLPDFREAAKQALCRRNTVNQAPNRRNAVELQPIPNSREDSRRRRHSYEDQEI